MQAEATQSHACMLFRILKEHLNLQTTMQNANQCQRDSSPALHACQRPLTVGPVTCMHTRHLSFNSCTQKHRSNQGHPRCKHAMTNSLMHVGCSTHLVRVPAPVDMPTWMRSDLLLLHHASACERMCKRQQLQES